MDVWAILWSLLTVLWLMVTLAYLRLHLMAMEALLIPLLRLLDLWFGLRAFLALWGCHMMLLGWHNLITIIMVGCGASKWHCLLVHSTQSAILPYNLVSLIFRLLFSHAHSTSAILSSMSTGLSFWRTVLELSFGHGTNPDLKRRKLQSNPDVCPDHLIIKIFLFHLAIQFCAGMSCPKTVPDWCVLRFNIFIPSNTPFKHLSCTCHPCQVKYIL